MGREVGWAFPSAPLYIPLFISVLWQQENSVQPGKRPLSFLLPTVVRPAEGLCGTYLALGANGAARGLSGLTQVRATPLWIFCSQEPFLTCLPCPTYCSPHLPRNRVLRCIGPGLSWAQMCCLGLHNENGALTSGLLCSVSLKSHRPLICI